MSDQRVEAIRTIAAPADRIFAIVADPRGQVRIDGSGMLVAAVDAQPLTGVGETFAMDMDREPLGDLPMGRYAVLNTVTRFEPGVIVEWNVAANGRRPVGHVYGYHLDPLDADRTRVTSYCDWSGLNPKLREHVRFPVVPLSMLEATLERLERLVTDNDG